MSVVSLLIPIANHLEQAKSGTLGVITSVAADRGRPRNYTYGAAKGALNTYLQGLRTRLYAAGVSVTTVKLGPVGYADDPAITKSTPCSVRRSPWRARFCTPWTRMSRRRTYLSSGARSCRL